MTKEKEAWTEFCKAAVPHVDEIRRLAAEHGIPEDEILDIFIRGKKYANMSIKNGGTFYDCTARKEGAYKLSAFGGGKSISFGDLFSFGTITRNQKGGDTNETQKDPHCQAAGSRAEEADQGCRAGSGEVAGVR